MATTTRQATKTITMPPAAEESVPEPVTQRKQADTGRFRLQVDRQTKASYATYEAAEKAGLGIKKEHPILQVAVYDSVEGVNKIIDCRKYDDFTRRPRVISPAPSRWGSPPPWPGSRTRTLAAVWAPSSDQRRRCSSPRPMARSIALTSGVCVGLLC